MFGFFEKKQYQLTIDGYPSVQLEHKETVLNGAVRSNIDFPHSCKAGGCAACKCKLISGKVKELTDKTYLLSKEELDQNMILGCQSIPKSNVVVELLNDPRQQQERLATIIAQRGLTHDILEVIVSLDAPINYLPGQYAQISAFNQSFPARSYSFAHAKANESKGSPSVSFFVRAVPTGKMSNWLLSHDALGEKLLVKASFGEFYLRETNNPMICIAGGSGLAPLISILEHALIHENPQQKKRDVLLLVGARSQKDLYYINEIEAIKDQWVGEFSYQAVLSDEPESSSWQGARGMVTDMLDTQLPNNTEGYFCGPPPMIDAAIEKMRDSGIHPNKLYFDKFSDQSI